MTNRMAPRIAPRELHRLALRVLSCVVLLTGVAAGGVSAQVASLLPVPRSLVAGDGRFPLDQGTTVAITGHRDARLERAVARAVARLAERVGRPLAPATGVVASHATIEVRVEGAGAVVQGIDEDESYRLEVSPERVLLAARTTVGAMRGLETMLQLVVGDSSCATLPAVTIDDAPRFPWRGLLLDVSRHFMPVDQVRRTLDGMAMVKLNVLHWHLSDDQGFRVESRRFPRLHTMGSDGAYYTQREVRAIVAYARDRGIRVVPEFDMPGHSTSWLVGYPQHGTKKPPVALRREWGGANAIFDPTREATYVFIARFIAEMAPLFPDAYWHVGGDEVEGKHWNSNRAIVAWRRRRGMRDNAALQAYFNRRLSGILSRLGKRMMGWDEILHPDLPQGTVVQSWRGTQYLADGAKGGFTGILSAPWYLDYMKPASDFYLADPVPQFDELTPAQRALIVGGEACMWSEFVSAESADSRIWPRLGAVAERLWSPREVVDVADMYRRLPLLAGRLDEVGIRAESHTTRMLRRIAPGLDVAPVESLLTAVQPPRFGQTVDGRMTDQRHSLTRVVDAAPPDPPGRWAVERLVRRLAQDRTDAAARDSLAPLFERWAALPPHVRALGARSPVLAEAVPVADALARVSAVALEALGILAAAEGPAPGWGEARAAELQTYVAPRGNLRVAVTADVAKLVAVAALR